MKNIVILLVVGLIALNVHAQTGNAKRSMHKQPPAPTRIVSGVMMSPANDVIKNLSKSKDYTILVSMINASGLTQTLRSGTYTLLAPTNNAFKKLPAGTIDTLMAPAHNAQLIKQVDSYIIQGKLTSKDIAKLIKTNGEASITTLAGNVLTARLNANRNIVLTDSNGEQAVVSKFDIAQSNGLLDIITMPLLQTIN